MVNSTQNYFKAGYYLQFTSSRHYSVNVFGKVEIKYSSVCSLLDLQLRSTIDDMVSAISCIDSRGIDHILIIVEVVLEIVQPVFDAEEYERWHVRTIVQHHIVAPNGLEFFFEFRFLPILIWDDL